MFYLSGFFIDTFVSTKVVWAKIKKQQTGRAGCAEREAQLKAQNKTRLTSPKWTTLALSSVKNIFRIKSELYFQ